MFQESSLTSTCRSRRSFAKSWNDSRLSTFKERLKTFWNNWTSLEHTWRVDIYMDLPTWHWFYYRKKNNNWWHESWQFIIHLFKVVLKETEDFPACHSRSICSEVRLMRTSKSPRSRLRNGSTIVHILLRHIAEINMVDQYGWFMLILMVSCIPLVWGPRQNLQ